MPRPRVTLLVLAVVLAGAALGVSVADLDPLVDGPAVPWWAIAAAVAVAELAVVRVRGREVSLSDAPVAAGLVLLSPGALLVGQAAGLAVALARTAPLK